METSPKKHKKQRQKQLGAGKSVTTQTAIGNLKI
jgi:hypothetical protein